MKTEAENEETNMFLKKEAESDDDNVWDDTLLVRAYDRAIYKAKQQILDKIKDEMGLTESDVQDVLGDAPSDASSDAPSPTKQKKRKNKRSADNISMWKVGSACRAIYSEDGEEYEAKVVKKIDGNWCIVRFIGYNNEEEVLFRELMPSYGNNVVQLQFATAKCYNAALQEQEMDTDDQNSVEEGELPQKESSGATLPEFKLPFPPRREPMMHPPHVPPPTPSMLPGAFIGAENAMGGPSIPFPRTTDENLNAMLVSWYMCGYYTGYYQRESNNIINK